QQLYPTRAISPGARQLREPLGTGSRRGEVTDQAVSSRHIKLLILRFRQTSPASRQETGDLDQTGGK
ncbi:hypothetical protein J6590_097440, partial [Homalodisca vitripennis]